MLVQCHSDPILSPRNSHSSKFNLVHDLHKLDSQGSRLFRHHSRQNAIQRSRVGNLPDIMLNLVPDVEVISSLEHVFTTARGLGAAHDGHRVVEAVLLGQPYSLAIRSTPVTSGAEPGIGIRPPGGHFGINRHLGKRYFGNRFMSLPPLASGLFFSWTQFGPSRLVEVITCRFAAAIAMLRTPELAFRFLGF